MNIDDYIMETAHMQNTSDGGSAAYHFDNVCLVKYQGQTKYGRTRESAELIAQKANEKRKKGVRTPAHLGIKRVIEGEKEICWVLQERAKGKNFNNYCSNKDSQVQIAMQSRLANAPDAHYEKLVSDVCELFNLGIELKPKNIFYDESLEDGGFTIIDLLQLHGKPFNPNSLKDVLCLDKMMQCIYNRSEINYSDNNISEREKELSKQLRFKIIQKIFSAMEKAIPNFSQHRRWVLRSMNNDILDFFAENGTKIADLALNDQEYQEFNQNVKRIIDDSIQKIANGTHEYWEVRVNEINGELIQSGMSDAWRYHKANNRKLNDFSGNYPYYEYNRTCTKDLETILQQIFDEELDILSNHTTNSLILKAKNALDNERINQATMMNYESDDEFNDEPRGLTEEERSKIIETLAVFTTTQNVETIKTGVTR